MCWEVFFDLESKRKRLDAIEREAAAPDFWNSSERAQSILKERAELSSLVGRVDTVAHGIEDANVLLELYEESKDESLLEECAQAVSALESALRESELARMLSGPHDGSDAILEINSGAGGTEAQDWGEMLLRMYQRWAERHGFQVEVWSYLAGDGAGIKSATLYIKGRNAFGYLRSERGVHRLVRISPFDSNARRHTSFASVSVVPDIETEINIEVRDEDLRVDTYRSSGAGGQHVNKTDSAVRLTHLPSGIVVACQNERSQHKNKAMAMKMLKAKLYERERTKQKEEIDKIAGERKKIDFGSQIRNYVMQPYQLVKDVRTEIETGNVQAVLDGDLDQFIEAYLLQGNAA